jgi:hypothetical protein
MRTSSTACPSATSGWEIADLVADGEKAAAHFRCSSTYRGMDGSSGGRLHSTLGYRSPAEFEEDNKIKKVA